jgi:hypothetical protein
MSAAVTKEDIEYAERLWPGDSMGNVRYGYLEGVRMEREACAKIAESYEWSYDEEPKAMAAIAAAIRARTQP